MDCISQRAAELAGEDFGRQRIWMSVGWGSSGAIVGRLLDQGAFVQDCSVAFNCFTVAMALATVAALFVKVVGSSTSPGVPGFTGPFLWLT